MKHGFFKILTVLPLSAVLISLASAAQAASLNGTINFNNQPNSIVTFNKAVVDFNSDGASNTAPISVNSTTDNFNGVTGGTISDLSSPVGIPNVPQFSFNAVVPNFLTFTGGPSTIFFDVSRVTRFVNPGGIQFVFEGIARATGFDPTIAQTTFAVTPALPSNTPFLGASSLDELLGIDVPGANLGTLTAQRLGLTATTFAAGQAVPEPLTILGSSFALASIAALKRKRDSKKVLSNV